jgi:hypothetical protein
MKRVLMLSSPTRKNHWRYLAVVIRDVEPANRGASCVTLITHCSVVGLKVISTLLCSSRASNTEWVYIAERGCCFLILDF